MTDKQTEALKLALEAAYLAGFNDSAEGYNGEYPFRDYGGTPTKDRLWVFRRDEYIREALAEQPAQQQQEPVEWDGRCVLGHCGSPTGCELSDRCRADCTSPPASKPWVGLTEDEKTEIRREHYARMLPLMDAVEAKLREKNA